MDYATAYDVGDRKRGSGINEDSVAVCIFEDGHRDGLVRSTDPTEHRRSRTREEDVQAATAETDDGPTDLASLLAGRGDGDEGADGSEETGTEGREGAGTGGSVATADGNEQERADATEGGTGAVADGENRGVAVFALADGAGGYEAGDVASYLASTVVVEELAPVAARAARTDPAAFDVEVADVLPDRPTTADFQSAITDAVQTAHRSILAYADSAGQPAFTTIVAGVAVGGQLHYGWVGDSRAYVVSERAGTIERLTRDHSVVADLETAGAIDEVEAHVHPRGNEITAALGGHPGGDVEGATVGVETHTVPLYAEDVVLVTSDGLVDAQTDAPSLHDEYVSSDGSEAVAERILEAVVTDDEVRDIVSSADSLRSGADDLVGLANDRGGKDNLSVVLFRDPSAPTSPDPARIPTRAIDPDEPLEDRQTVILPDE